MLESCWIPSEAPEMCVCVCVQLCPTLCNPMNCTPLGSCPWNFPGKNTDLEPRDQTCLSTASTLAGRFLNTSATWGSPPRSYEIESPAPGAPWMAVEGRLRNRKCLVDSFTTWKQKEISNSAMGSSEKSSRAESFPRIQS